MKQTNKTVIASLILAITCYHVVNAANKVCILGPDTINAISSFLTLRDQKNLARTCQSPFSTIVRDPLKAIKAKIVLPGTETRTIKKTRLFIAREIFNGTLQLPEDASGMYQVPEDLIKQARHAIRLNLSLSNAVQSSNVFAVQMALDRNEQPDQCDDNGRNFLHQAVINNSFSVVSRLLSYSAEHHINLDIPDNAGISPLYLACSKRGCDSEIIELLISYGAVVTPTMHLCSSLQHRDSVRKKLVAQLARQEAAAINAVNAVLEEAD